MTWFVDHTCCQDCGLEKPAEEIRKWTWYDFYEPQGDEPRLVCRECWALPQHKQRMAEDAYARKEELGY